MKRRDFVKIITGLSIASLLGYFLIPSFEEVVRGMIKNITAKLPIPQGAIDQFIAEANQEKYWNQFGTFKREFIRMHYLLSNRLFSLPYFNKYEQYKNQIVGWFLLSTDYFTNSSEPVTQVKYVAFYNPYKRACGVPFSNIYHSQVAA